MSSFFELNSKHLPPWKHCKLALEIYTLQWEEMIFAEQSNYRWILIILITDYLQLTWFWIFSSAAKLSMRKSISAWAFHNSSYTNIENWASKKGCDSESQSAICVQSGSLKLRYNYFQLYSVITYECVRIIFRKNDNSRCYVNFDAIIHWKPEIAINNLINNGCTVSPNDIQVRRFARWQ